MIPIPARRPADRRRQESKKKRFSKTWFATPVWQHGLGRQVAKKNIVFQKLGFVHGFSKSGLGMPLVFKTPL